MQNTKIPNETFSGMEKQINLRWSYFIQKTFQYRLILMVNEMAGIRWKFKFLWSDFLSYVNSHMEWKWEWECEYYDKELMVFRKSKNQHVLQPPSTVFKFGQKKKKRTKCIAFWFRIWLWLWPWFSHYAYTIHNSHK